MKNAGKKKSNYFFIVISLFFFLFMIFIFWNLSSRMFENAVVMIAMDNTQKLKSALTIVNDNSEAAAFTKDVNATAKIIKTESILKLFSLNIYSADKKLLYTWGRKIDVIKNLSVDDLRDKDIVYNKTYITNSVKLTYQTIFSVKKRNSVEAYVEILYDLTSLKNALFSERLSIYVFVILVNFLITMFLCIMILNLRMHLDKKEKQISTLSTIDDLTGLNSKENFTKLVKKEMERIERNGGKLTLMIFDIDDFLSINKNFGDEFGDLVIQTLSKIVLDNFRTFDIVGRFGGDEFAVIMVDSDLDEGYIASERCRKSIEDNKFYEGTNEIAITISAGLSTIAIDKNIPLEDKSPNKTGIYRNLIFTALNNLAIAKKNGKNRIEK
ncbi:MAG TPA: GGDEF domain-containing protein [Spirochaetota bacterium]|nr:GGDEF domain-containing protein [Spirochaetota bacterium]HOS33537.1 GGDEF domain-containing protein [Spirochaetota bacterium]HOS54931.1 GGDEF domain-containing protein [Spirochaetota bacterium]HPK61555.1 GGDEF domain-containing protein [Spirochaetota bacterium]HQF77274.1 GGDEF domain-containing protein [Spirochaetota bacterium]